MEITAREIVDKALSTLPFEPVGAQGPLLMALATFATAAPANGVFVLNGYAGTGKTSMTGAFIKAMEALKRHIVLLAPTGRAAKVAQSFSGHPASTIHKHIFRGNSLDPGNTQFFLARNTYKDTLFIVDEASLIGDRPGDDRGSLLRMLAGYVYSAPGCRMILVGDEAQLPPVGQESSTAMNPDRLRMLGLEPVRFSLDLPVRQAAMSGIVHNATLVREFLLNPDLAGNLELEVSQFPDVAVVSGAELADTLSDSWSQVGRDETLIITRSNRRANNFNNAIRNMVMYAEEPLQRGDRIVISKNDYFWGARNDSKGFIANGETAEITWVGRTEKNYGRYFTDVEMRLVSDDRLIGAKVMLRSLACDGPAIDRAEMTRFYNRVLDAYEGEMSHKIKGALEDPFYNALQIKYAYCVTCHKAQGGQWRHVYIDMGSIPDDAYGPDFYRWLYTAMTRATEKVFLINPRLPVR